MIAFFVYNLGQYSGAAFQALNIAKRLPSPIAIYNIGSPFVGDVPEHIRIFNIDCYWWLRPIYIASSLFIHRVQLIHFHGQFLLPMILAKILGLPFILKTTLLGDDDFDSIRKKRFGELRLWISKRCSVNIVLSNRLMEINGQYLDRSRIQLVPNGVEIEREPPSFAEKKNNFYFCGVISSRKNTLKSIEVFGKHYAGLEGAKLYVIGPDKPYGVGKEVDESYVRECISYVNKFDLQDKVTFTGLMPQAQVREIIRSCKALLFFSEFEGMPNVVLEAMASNCVPVISSMQGVGAEIVGENAGFVSNNVYPSIFDIDKMIQSQSPIGRAASNFSFEKVTQLILQTYRQCLA